MPSPPPAATPPDYLATERGLFTAGGQWYRTTEPLLERYAAPVLERVPLPRLLAASDAWLEAPGTLALWTLALVLLVSTAPAAVGAALLGFAAAFLLGPALASLAGAAVLKVMSKPLLQAFLFVGVLTWISGDDRTAAVVTGLVGFVALRWGLLQRAVGPVLEPLRRQLYPIPAPDQTLRALIVRTALRHKLSLSELDAMEARVRDAVLRGK